MLAVPAFMMAIILILVFAVTLGWLPATGWVRLTDDPLGNLRTAILPALSLAVGELAVYTRLLRADMITTLQQDSLPKARAQGIGAVIVETLFALPGIGRLLVDSISQRDLVMVQGVTLVIATSFVVINFVVDILYMLLDPRIRHGRAATA